MPQKRRNNGFILWLWRQARRKRAWERLGRRQRPSGPRRGPRLHVIILDGTLSSLLPGCETHAGQTYKLLCAQKSSEPSLSIYYEPGVQWADWRATWSVMTGKGINRQIRRAYGYLASRYRPGDKIFLFGYSRGAFAVRSLAGLIDQVGLLKARSATERNVALAYRHYQCTPDAAAARSFRQAHCHDDVPIDMVGVWDTVKALGLRLPVLWRLSEPTHAFHSHALGESVKSGFHALAYDEMRQAYAPVLWEVPPDQEDRVEQMWFPGNHSDVGGQINGHQTARPLANLSLVWMLGRAQHRGLPLPKSWRERFPTDTSAPSVGAWFGWAKLFILRRKRRVLSDLSERLHPALVLRLQAVDGHDRVSQRLFLRFRRSTLGKAK